MRTVYCGDLNISSVGLEVRLCGWVNRCRIFSEFVFIDIRDREGSVQVFFDPKHNYDTFLSATKLRNEFCVQVMGKVRARPAHQVNINMKTGEVEVLASDIKIVSTSESLPLDLNKENTEEIRLTYRYLDLRRPIMIERLKNRSRITSYIHRFMEMKGFLNIETPMLTHATPEGARNYLVPSRLHKGKFYALPQSPQVFKQLLMVAGFDRYYQITKCFRDEDMRSDRQPEFTQIDLEASFISSEEVREITECLIRNLWRYILGVELKKFPQMTYKEVIRKFASDSPDLRNPVEIDYIFNVGLEQVKYHSTSILETKNNVSLKIMIMFVPNGGQISNNSIIRYIEDFKVLGGVNLVWLKVKGFGSSRTMEGSALSYLRLDVLKKIVFQKNLSEKDLVFLSYGDHFSNHALHVLRSRLGDDLQLVNKNDWAPLWVIDFPMFKKDIQGNIVSMHHLFTAPKNSDLECLLKDPLSSVANSFDMVINGYEVGSGSMRIHSYAMQKMIFHILGISKNLQESQFGFLLNALKYGPPIHAGIACGLDRLVMLLNKTSNIRDVIAFPKTTNAMDLMTKSPNMSYED